MATPAPAPRPQRLLGRPPALLSAMHAHWAQHRELQGRTEAAVVAATAATARALPPAPTSCAGGDSSGSDEDEGCEVADFLGSLGGSSDSDDGDNASSPGAGACADTDTGAVVRLARSFQRAKGDWPHVLDIGCGDGALLAALHDQLGLPWRQLAGITADPPTAGWDLRRHIESSECLVALDDFESPTTPEPVGDVVCGFDWGRRFDLIVSFNTFHHLVDPLGAVSTAYRLLRPGGVLYLAGVPVDTLRAPGTTQSIRTVKDDVASIRQLRKQMQRQGERVEMLVDPLSVSREWIRRARVVSTASHSLK